jgi:hypothetical protein
VTTSNGSGCPVIWSKTASSLASLPFRMTLKNSRAPGRVAVTS